MLVFTMSSHYVTNYISIICYDNVVLLPGWQGWSDTDSEEAATELFTNDMWTQAVGLGFKEY